MRVKFLNITLLKSVSFLCGLICDHIYLAGIDTLTSCSQFCFISICAIQVATSWLDETISDSIGWKAHQTYNIKMYKFFFFDWNTIKLIKCLISPFLLFKLMELSYKYSIRRPSLRPSFVAEIKAQFNKYVLLFVSKTSNIALFLNFMTFLHVYFTS